MAKANKWRCGRRRYHDDEHGDWVEVSQYKREKWRCGVVAQSPEAERKEGDRFNRWNCPWPSCSYLHPESGPARQHWYTHIYAERLKVFRGEHGTEAGYHEHRSLGEEPCNYCKKAHSDHNARKARGWVRRYPGPRIHERKYGEW